MTVQQRGYSGVADPKLCFYSYRRAGSEWSRESTPVKMDNSEMKCVKIKYWGKKVNSLFW